MNKYVKDFYILPLAATTAIPEALLPLNGIGFPEDPRPPLLIGIIVRTKKKRAIGDSGSSGGPTKKTKVEVRVTTPPSMLHSGRSYTPPPEKSARIDPRLRNAAAATSVHVPEEPSTPSGEDDDGQFRVYIYC